MHTTANVSSVIAASLGKPPLSSSTAADTAKQAENNPTQQGGALHIATGCMTAGKSQSLGSSLPHSTTGSPRCANARRGLVGGDKKELLSNFRKALQDIDPSLW